MTLIENAVPLADVAKATKSTAAPQVRGGSAMTEYASGARNTFPVEWGVPVGRPYSEERAAWVRKMVEKHAALTAHRKLANKDARLLAVLRRAELERRRDG